MPIIKRAAIRAALRGSVSNVPMRSVVDFGDHGRTGGRYRPRAQFGSCIIDILATLLQGPRVLVPATHAQHNPQQRHFGQHAHHRSRLPRWVRPQLTRLVDAVLERD